MFYIEDKTDIGQMGIFFPGLSPNGLGPEPIAFDKATCIPTGVLSSVETFFVGREPSSCRSETACQATELQ